jgi:hypothetical protein
VALPAKPAALRPQQVANVRRAADTAASAYTRLGGASPEAPEMALAASDVSGLNAAQRTAAAKLAAQRQARAQTVDYLGRLNAICVSSASGVNDLSGVLAQVEGGQIYPWDGAARLNSTIQNRSGILDQLNALPNPPAPARGLSTQLFSAINASRQADIAYQRWMSSLPSDYSSGYYGSSWHSGADWVALTTFNGQATSGKQVFRSHFVRVASRYGVASSCGKI